MNKKIISLICIMSICGVSLKAVHELRTPLSLTSRLNPINGSFHFPLKYVDEEKINVDFWAGAYYRQACQGFCPKVCDWCCNSCCNDRVTYACGSGCNGCNTGISTCSSGCCSNNAVCGANTNYVGCFDCNGKRVPLARLFFGKDAFYGADAFTSDSFESDSVMNTIALSPSIDYDEKGIVLGFHIEHKVECGNWRVGFNALLPIKKVKVEVDLACNCCAVLSGENGDDPLIDLAKKAIYKLEYLPDLDVQAVDITAIGETFAYRLDFLNDLGLVEFPGGGSIKIAGVDIGEKDDFLSPGERIFPVVAYRPPNDDIKVQLTTLDIFDASEVPTSFPEPKSLTIGNPNDNGSYGNELVVLPVDGSIPLNPPAVGSISEKRARYYRYIDQGATYNIPEGTQEQIYIVPGYARTNGNNNTMYTAGAMTIKNRVDQLIRELEQDGEAKKSPETILAEYGICLEDGACVTGLGDLDTSFYVGYDFNDRSFAELVFGMRFPTGKKNLCPAKIYRVSTGNNGHFEAKLGVDAGWRSEKWFGVHAEAYYSHVLEATEKRNAIFSGAKIRGIGPCIDAKVKWGYFVGHLDMTVFHPENQKMGFALGYEIYYKRNDRVKFCGVCLGDRAQDFLGNIVQLDSTMAMVDTNILSHKLRGEVYHRWDYFELYAGVSRVVAGWNCMLENELHIGFSINF